MLAADPGFPVGGGGRRPVGECRPLKLLGRNMCENKSIGSHGGCALAAPPGPATACFVRRVPCVVVGVGIVCAQPS